MFAVTVTIHVKGDKIKAFSEAVTIQSQKSLSNESGCHHFDVCFDIDDPERIFLYEIYTDRQAFDTHLKTDHFHNFITTVKDWIVSKTDEFWERQES